VADGILVFNWRVLYAADGVQETDVAPKRILKPLRPGLL